MQPHPKRNTVDLDPGSPFVILTIPVFPVLLSARIPALAGTFPKPCFFTSLYLPAIRTSTKVRHAKTSHVIWKYPTSWQLAITCFRKVKKCRNFETKNGTCQGFSPISNFPFSRHPFSRPVQGVPLVSAHIFMGTFRCHNYGSKIRLKK